MLAIWKREFLNYFLTPIGYVFVGIYLLINGFFFFMFNLYSSSPDLNTLFSNMTSVFTMIMPILTMKLLSEERRSKTDQLLLTAPCTIADIVVGKFLSAVSVLFIAMAFTGVYVVILAIYSSPYPLTILSSYVGSFLLGCCYVAIGLLMSALTENQVSAAVLTYGVNLALQLLESIMPQVTIPYLSFLSKAFSWLSLNSRYVQFTSGILSIANVMYYLSFAGVILFLAVRVIDKRRWSEG